MTGNRTDWLKNMLNTWAVTKLDIVYKAVSGHLSFRWHVLDIHHLHHSRHLMLWYISSSSDSIFLILIVLSLLSVHPNMLQSRLVHTTAYLVSVRQAQRNAVL